MSFENLTILAANPKEASDSLTGAAEMVRAIATLLWPLLVGFLAIFYRKEIRHLVARLQRGKLLGAEIELNASLDQLQQEASRAAAEVPVPAPEVPGAGETAAATAQPSHDPADEFITTVLSEAARSPKLGLMLLASGLDRLARQVSAATGRPSRSLPQAMGMMREQLPSHVGGALRLFMDARNRIVHGADASDEEALRAIDSGITLYRALNSIPRETNVVYHPGVPVFSDEECVTAIPETRGLILETTDPAGGRTFRIYPTTRTHYRKGMRVAWEWNMALVWNEAWYRDPDTDEVKKAWDSSGEFIGRDLDQV